MLYLYGVSFSQQVPYVRTDAVFGYGVTRFVTVRDTGWRAAAQRLNIEFHRLDIQRVRTNSCELLISLF